MDYQAALAYLDEHVNLERMLAGRTDAPTLDRMRRLAHVLGDPQGAAPVVHVTGTNGKGSTSQVIGRVLTAHGLTVGTFASPHLQRINERMLLDGEPIGDDDFADMIAAVAAVEPFSGVRPSYFEILTAAAFRWFADLPVDVVVLEVGMLGRWDATNVADGRVAVVTNVELDHTEYAGPTRAHIAAEKAGIVKPGSTLVLGEGDPSLAPVFDGAGAAEVWRRGDDFGVVDNRTALGGRVLSLRTPGGAYGDLFLPLHGAHQGDNAAVAVAAVEALLGAPPRPELVAEGFAGVRMPGRFEVVGHRPLVVLDGAHNPAGARVANAVLSGDFAVEGRRIDVVGMLHGKDPVEMLTALGSGRSDVVVCCTAPSPRALPAAEIAAAARALGRDALVVDDVAAAVEAALDEAESDDCVLVSGSLYVVGAARSHLVR